MRRRAALAALAILAAACSGAGAGEQVAAPSPTTEATAAPTPEPTPSPEPSPSPSEEEPPEVDLTAEDGDYRRVVEEILRFRAWLFAHPHRQDLVSRVYLEDCNCHDNLVTDLEAFANSNRWLEADFVISRFEVLERDQVSVRIAISVHTDGRVYENGEVVEEGVTPPEDQEWLLLREPSGRHRVASQIGIEKDT